jgi:hypothetical protein
MTAVHVLQAGSLQWAPVDCEKPGCTCGNQRALLVGWGFGHDAPVEPAELLAAAIRHIAAHNGVVLEPDPAEPAPENFDAQREALDTIAVARWGGDPLKWEGDDL